MVLATTGSGAVSDAEAAGRALIEIARMAETESRALDRAFRVLGDGALVGPAATRLWEDLARRHAQLRQAFERAFASVEAIAARGDGPPPRVAMPYLRPAPVPPPRREIVGGDPNLIEILATEVTRAGRSWEDAGHGLRNILARAGADPSPGVAVVVAGDWVAAERRDLLHRRADLLKQVELAALEGGYGEFMPAPGQGAAGSALDDAAAPSTSGAVAGRTVTGGAATGTQEGRRTNVAGAGGLTQAQALRGVLSRLNPLNRLKASMETWLAQPESYLTRRVADGLNRLGLHSLAGEVGSVERAGKSFLVGVNESAIGLAGMVWGVTPVGAAFNRGADSAEQVLDPVHYNQESLAQIDGLIWGAQHPIEFGKAAVDWQTLQEDPARWTGRMTPEAIMSAAAGGGMAARGWKAAKEAGKGASRVGRGMRSAEDLSDAAMVAGRAAANVAKSAAEAATRVADATMQLKTNSERILDQWKDNDAGDRWGRSHWDDVIDEMHVESPEVHDTVVRYTGDDYTDINGFLRGDPKYFEPGTRDLKPEYAYLPEMVRRIDEALQLKTVPEDVVVSRVTGLDEFNRFRQMSAAGNEPSADAFARLLNNERETQDAYLSTGAAPHPTFGMWNKKVVIWLKVPKGTPGMYVEKLTQHPGENELLLGRGLSYDFSSAKMVKGMLHVEAEIVPGATKE